MKIGLVLSGGGGKGAYELGVWKALKELNLNKYISVFSGTSIGAFNAALFAMDDLEKAEKLWDEVTMDKLVPISKKELIKRGIGLYLGGKSPQLAMRFLSDKLDHGAISNEGAIEVSRVANIPKNFNGIMGVPITFIDKYNPEQFEILACSAFSDPDFFGCGALYVNDKKTYARVLIKRI